MKDINTAKRASKIDIFLWGDVSTKATVFTCLHIHSFLFLRTSSSFASCARPNWFDGKFMSVFNSFSFGSLFHGFSTDTFLNLLIYIWNMVAISRRNYCVTTKYYVDFRSGSCFKKQPDDTRLCALYRGYKSVLRISDNACNHFRK